MEGYSIYIGKASTLHCRRAKIIIITTNYKALTRCSNAPLTVEIGQSNEHLYALPHPLLLPHSSHNLISTNRNNQKRKQSSSHSLTLQLSWTLFHLQRECATPAAPTKLHNGDMAVQKVYYSATPAESGGRGRTSLRPRSASSPDRSAPAPIPTSSQIIPDTQLHLHPVARDTTPPPIRPICIAMPHQRLPPAVCARKTLQDAIAPLPKWISINWYLHLWNHPSTGIGKHPPATPPLSLSEIFSIMIKVTRPTLRTCRNCRTLTRSCLLNCLSCLFCMSLVRQSLFHG